MRRQRLRGLVLALAALAACGGGGGGGGGGSGLADLTGTWWLTPYRDAVAEDPRHVTMTQTGTDLAAELTCEVTFPDGVGTWDAGVFSLTFDLGGGDALTLSGGALGDGIAGSFTAPDGPGTFTLERTTFVPDCGLACDPLPVVAFVDTDFTDLAMVREISRFRSSAGHEYIDGCESCRSMKHYFAPFAQFAVNGVIPVRSPVAGTVAGVTAEGHGASPPGINKQIGIRSTDQPDYLFVLFHVDLADAGLAAGDTVTEGQLLGHARMYYDDLGETAHDFDIAVRVSTPSGPRLVSWFETMTDALFASYVARGVASRSDLIVTRAARDADPLSCSGGAFTSRGSIPSWVVLGPP